MNICVLFEILENREQKIETYLFDVSENVNGKNSWVSSEGYKIFWYTGDTNQWVLSGIPNTFIFTYTTNDIPFTGWQILGSRPPKEIKNLRVTTGDCENNIVVDYKINIKNTNCKCNGSIIIDPFSGVKPFTYYLNNIKQDGNFIENLCEGKYIVKVEDNKGSLTIKETRIPKNNITEYFVTLNYNKTTGYFEVTCNPLLTDNIKIKFDLVYQNVLNYSPQINSVLQNSAEQVILSGKDIGKFTNSYENTQITNLQRPCVGNTYKVVKTKEWRGITIESGDTLNGYINSTISPNIDIRTLCYNANQDLTLTFKNLEIINCECCNITKVIINK